MGQGHTVGCSGVQPRLGRAPGEWLLALAGVAGPAIVTLNLRTGLARPDSGASLADGGEPGLVWGLQWGPRPSPAGLTAPQGWRPVTPWEHGDPGAGGGARVAGRGARPGQALCSPADCLLMLVYKDRGERAKGLRERSSLMLEDICGLDAGLPHEGLAHTLAIVCLSQAVMLGFDTREAMCAWDARIRYALGEGEGLQPKWVAIYAE